MRTTIGTATRALIMLGLSASAALVNTAVLAQVRPSIAGLQAQINSLQSDLEEVQASIVPNLADYMSVNPLAPNGPAVRIEGANLQLTNGQGLTASANGLGNLIVGYNEVRTGNSLCSLGQFADEPACTGGGGTWSADHKSGSHNVVIGAAHAYSRWAGLAAGQRNVINGDAATVSGGTANMASGPFTSVSGGQSNVASGSAASVTAGTTNTASGVQASVTGGTQNRASNTLASVHGGIGNQASGARATVNGGQGNIASGLDSAVSGGLTNEASGDFATVTGGESNDATARAASVTGGFSNAASGAGSTVSGGASRSATSGNDWVAGALLQDQ